MEPAFRVTDPIEALRTPVPDLRRAADLVVVLAHVGGEQARSLAAAVPGIDVIVAGHGSASAPAVEHVGATALVENSDRGKHLYRLDLDLAGDPAAAVTTTLERLVLGPEIARHSGVEALLAAYRRRLESLPPPPERAAPGPRFVGAAGCVACHAEAGTTWSRSGHGRALEALEQIDHGAEPECVRCHVTGYGEPGGFRTRALTPDRAGVQCESCHGPGGDHAVKPEKGWGRVVTPDRCRDCHTGDNSPGFDFDRYWPKIRH